MKLLRVFNKKRSAYSAAELQDLNDYLDDYLDNARKSESRSIDDLHKHLWLANGAALTVSVGYMQVNHNSIDHFQYMGVTAFIAGLALLVFLKYLYAFIGSRDRYRFQEAVGKFANDVEPDVVLQIENIRDGLFKVLQKITVVLVYAAGAAFLFGCITTVIGLS